MARKGVLGAPRKTDAEVVAEVAAGKIRCTLFAAGAMRSARDAQRCPHVAVAVCAAEDCRSPFCEVHRTGGRFCSRACEEEGDGHGG
jgi:hypothetical protein